MSNIVLKLVKKKFFFIIFIFFFNISFSKAEIYEEIIVKGNERLSIETVIMFSGLKLGEDLDDIDLNDAIKKLYKTNYFKEIKFTTKDKVINISIVENPIIQSIKINGVKNNTVLEKLTDVTKKSEKYPFLKNNILDQNNLLLNIVRATGFYFAEIETKVVDNKNNSVDIIYDFNLGKRAIIKKINFQGNKIFRDSKLRNVIQSEEGRFWKFLTSNKYLDERKIKNDEFLLIRYFKKKGYYNVNVKSSYAKNINNQYFELTYNIDAGEKFYFNNISIDVSDNFNKENFEKINKDIKKFKGEKYSPKVIEKISDEIEKILLMKEYLFMNTSFDLSFIV